MIILGILTLWAGLGYFDHRRTAAFSIGAIYWHFVDVVWVVLFFTFYVSPHLSMG